MSLPISRAIRLPGWAWAAVPVLLGAWLRLRNIGMPDPFVDEGANILTALDSRVRAIFHPLEQGRPWLTYLFFPAGWFPTHALETARVMSAVAGLITLAALGWILQRLAGRIAGLFGMMLWATMPFAVFHERFALEDPFVTVLLALAAALVVKGGIGKSKSGKEISFFASGMMVGVAFLLKISALFALPWLGIFYATVQRRESRPLFDRRLVWIAFGLLLPALTLGTDLLHLGSGLGTYDALPSLNSEGFFAPFAQRMAIWMSWYAGYGGWPLFLAIAAAIILVAVKPEPLALGCLIGWVISLPVAGLFYHNTYARYVLPDQVPLILFISLATGTAVANGKKSWLVMGLLPALSAARWAGEAWQIGTAPIESVVPAAEIRQYLTGPWSGSGVSQLTDFLKEYADQNGVSCLVLTHRFHRPGCYGVMLAELGDPRIGVVPFTIYDPPDLAAARPGLSQVTAGRKVAFFILYEGSIYPAQPWLDKPGAPTQLIKVIERGEGESFRLYQFKP